MTDAAAELHAAIAAGDLERVRTLLQTRPELAGARDDEGVSALARAAYLRQGAILEALAAAGPPLDVFDAALLGRTDELGRLLILEPAAADAWSADGFTALHLAAFFDRPEAVGELLAASADPHVVARGSLAVTPLHAAAAGGSLESVRLLLDAGADVDARQPSGHTALMAAAAQGHEPMVRLLLERGADRTLTDGEGRTAADHARRSGHDALAPLLEATGQ